MNQIRKILRHSVMSVCLLTCSLSCIADEVVLDDSRSNGEIQLGDYNCTPYRVGASSNFPMPEDSITAGELWTFFEEQGLDSVESIVICVDIDRLPADQQLGLKSLDLLIEEPTDNLAHCSYTLGGNSLVFPGGNTKPHSAECRFRVELGYDFMQKYSSSSTEKVQLNVGLDEQYSGSSPAFFIEGNRSMFTLPNFLLLGCFGLFWVAVFWGLKRATLPKRATVEVQPPTVLSLESARMMSSDPA